MLASRTRREFLRDLGISSAVLPFVWNLPSLGFANQQKRKRRLVIMFSPNGVAPGAFWPDEEGDLTTVVGKSLEPLEPFKERTLVLRGIDDKVQSEGEAHQTGIGCLLTGIKLSLGNIKFDDQVTRINVGAGWASGISIDQELKKYLQRRSATRTRFGSLEFGVMVPDVATTWTRLVYAGPNQPLAPIDDPYQMFAKLYGRRKDKEILKSVIDDIRDELRKISGKVGTEDRRLLDEHATHIREIEQELKAPKGQDVVRAIPKLKAGVKRGNVPMGGTPEHVRHMPRITKMQIDLLVNSLANDFTRVATLQFTSAIGNGSMPWLGFEEGHHAVSHGDQNKLAKCDTWFCEQLAYLARRLAKTPEPGGGGSLLDNTLVVWTNEMGSGWHSKADLPFVLVGNGLNFRMGRMLKCGGVPHNRLWLSLAHGMGHQIKEFGNPEFCEEGPLPDLT